MQGIKVCRRSRAARVIRSPNNAKWLIKNVLVSTTNQQKCEMPMTMRASSELPICQMTSGIGHHFDSNSVRADVASTT
jgi:hypothetical protein